MFKRRIQTRVRLVHMFLAVSLLTTGLLFAIPTPSFACGGEIDDSGASADCQSFSGWADVDAGCYGYSRGVYIKWWVKLYQDGSGSPVQQHSGQTETKYDDDPYFEFSGTWDNPPPCGGDYQVEIRFEAYWANTGSKFDTETKWQSIHCDCDNGSITIVKETNPDGGSGFNFSGDLGPFTLSDNGSRSFDKAAGDYDVTESLPTDWELDSVECDDGDSTDITNGVTIHLDAGEHVTCTFTNIKQDGAKRRIKARKFNDENGNGDKGYGEDWLNGWDFTLSRKVSGAWVEIATVTTTGSYSSKGTADFGEQPIGYEYMIEETPQDGWTCTNCDTAEQPFTLSECGCGGCCGCKEVEFGNRQPPQRGIKACKFNDEDGSGYKDWDEDWLSGWEFTLKDSEGNVLATATTTESGQWSKGCADFGDWPVGDEYQIVETRQAGWACTNCATAEQPFTLEEPSTHQPVSVLCCPCGSKEVEFGNRYGGGQSICLPSIDFDTDAGGNPLAAGTIVAEQWSDWGVHVTTSNPTSHPVMIFDSSNPTGEDPDLGTPNADFGGPGIGNGGKSGTPGENNLSLGKILIISEDNNPSDPDDNSDGGTITFTFDEPTPVDEVHILDIEETGSKVKAYNAVSGGTKLAEVYMQIYGDNSFQVVPVNASGVRRLEIFFKGSGGVAAVVFCSEEGSLGDYVWNDVDRDGIQDGDESGIPGVTVELYLDANGDGIPQSEEFQGTDVTNENGLYLFTGLAAGDYIVKVADSNFNSGAVLDSYFVAVPNAGSDDAKDSDGHPITHEVAVTLASGENNMTIDFGFSDCEIGDRVWRDEDGEGDQDASIFPPYDPEPGFNYVVVYLYRDNGNGVFNRSEETFVYVTTTISGTSQTPDGWPDGIYGFDMSTQPSGDYWVWVDESTLPSPGSGLQWKLTTASNPLKVAGYVSGDIFSFDFGYVAETIPTAVTLSSFTARPSAGGFVSPRWLGMMGLVLASGSLFWKKRRAG